MRTRWGPGGTKRKDERRSCEPVHGWISLCLSTLTHSLIPSLSNPTSYSITHPLAHLRKASRMSSTCPGWLVIPSCANTATYSLRQDRMYGKAD